MTQLAMTGEDWKSDRDRARDRRAEAARKKAGLDCMRKCESAAAALRDYVRACNACGDNSGDELREISDGRHILADQLDEYAAFLDVYYKG